MFETHPSEAEYNDECPEGDYYIGYLLRCLPAHQDRAADDLRSAPGDIPAAELMSASPERLAWMISELTAGDTVYPS